MAQYSVKRACGHTTTEQLYGKGGERERRMTWLATQPCPACKRRAEQAQAATYTEAEGLPALSGSEKQVAWATTIRAGLVAGVMAERDTFLALGRRQGASDERIAEQMALFDRAVDAVRGQTSAAWWIDHRDESASALLREMARAAGVTR